MKRLLAFAGLLAIYPCRVWEAMTRQPRVLSENDVRALHITQTRPRR